MLKKFEDHKVGAGFYLANADDLLTVQKEGGNHLKFIWNTGEHQAHFQIDDRTISLNPQQVLCCTYLQRLDFSSDTSSPDLILLTFNRAFYCIHTHDAEVSCNGLLFFGSDYTPVISLDGEEQNRLGTLIDVLKDEFDTIDRNQDEMLRILLKRFIIRCTRLARKQLGDKELPESQIDIIRKFNILVEEHFKTHKQVADYADMLHRSPKTLTNVFSMYSEKTPLQIIHERVVLEAKRLLLYTDKSSKEIGLELGFEDPSQFSRFFKKYVQLTTQEFKERNLIGNSGEIAHTSGSSTI